MGISLSSAGYSCFTACLWDSLKPPRFFAKLAFEAQPTPEIGIPKPRR